MPPLSLDSEDPGLPRGSRSPPPRKPSGLLLFGLVLATLAGTLALAAADPEGPSGRPPPEQGLPRPSPASAPPAAGSAAQAPAQPREEEDADWTPSRQEGQAPQPPPLPSSAREVHEMLDARYRGDDTHWLTTMVLTNSRGEQRIYKMIRHRAEKDKAKGRLTKTLISYLAPADLRGTATLTLEREGDEDVQRIYLPELKKVRLVAAGDKGKAWMGTDFCYEDLREQKLDSFSYSALDEVSVSGDGNREWPCHHYFLTPKEEKVSAYGKIEYFVRKDILETVRTRYFDKKLACFKEANWSRFKRERGVWVPWLLRMEDRVERHRTEFHLNRVAVNTGLDDRLFSPSAMTAVPADFPEPAPPLARQNADPR